MVLEVIHLQKHSKNGSLSFTFSFMHLFIEQIYIEVMVLFNKVSAFYVVGIGVKWKKKSMNTYLITDYDRDLIRSLKYFRRKEISLRRCLWAEPWRTRGRQAWRKEESGQKELHEPSERQGEVQPVPETVRKLMWHGMKSKRYMEIKPLGKAYKISFIQGAVGEPL